MQVLPSGHNVPNLTIFVLFHAPLHVLPPYRPVFFGFRSGFRWPLFTSAGAAANQTPGLFNTHRRRGYVATPRPSTVWICVCSPLDLWNNRHPAVQISRISALRRHVILGRPHPSVHLLVFGLRSTSVSELLDCSLSTLRLASSARLHIQNLAKSGDNVHNRNVEIVPKDLVVVFSVHDGENCVCVLTTRKCKI